MLANRAEFISHMVETVGRVNTAADMAIFNMGIDMLRLQKIQAPHDQGGLSNSGELTRRGLKRYRIRFLKPYARRWEYNEEFTDRLGRHFRPAQFKKGKKSRYVRDPAETISRKHVKYFREASEAVRIGVK